MEFENSENLTHIIDEGNLINAEIVREGDLLTLSVVNTELPALAMIQINSLYQRRINTSRLEVYSYDPSKRGSWRFQSSYKLHVDPPAKPSRKRRKAAEPVEAEPAEEPAPEAVQEEAPASPPKPKRKRKAKAKANAKGGKKAKAE